MITTQSYLGREARIGAEKSLSSKVSTFLLLQRAACRTTAARGNIVWAPVSCIGVDEGEDPAMLPSNPELAVVCVVTFTHKKYLPCTPLQRSMPIFLDFQVGHRTHWFSC